MAFSGQFGPGFGVANAGQLASLQSSNPAAYASLMSGLQSDSGSKGFSLSEIGGALDFGPVGNALLLAGGGALGLDALGVFGGATGAATGAAAGLGGTTADVGALGSLGTAAGLDVGGSGVGAGGLDFLAANDAAVGAGAAAGAGSALGSGVTADAVGSGVLPAINEAGTTLNLGELGTGASTPSLGASEGTLDLGSGAYTPSGSSWLPSTVGPASDTPFGLDPSTWNTIKTFLPFGGTAPGANLNTAATLASTLYGLYNSKKIGDAASTANPNAAYAPGYAAQLAALQANPSSVTSTPGYQFNMDAGSQAIQRAAAAQGYTGSGNAAIALQQYGQNYATSTYNQQLQNLTAEMNGGNPGAQLSGEALAAQLASQSIAGLGYGLNRNSAPAVAAAPGA